MLKINENGDNPNFSIYVSYKKYLEGETELFLTCLEKIVPWMFALDHRREWKSIQRTNDRIEIKLAQWRKLQMQTEAVQVEHERLQRALSEAQSHGFAENHVCQFRDQVEKDALRRAESPPTLRAAATERWRTWWAIEGRVEAHKGPRDEG